MAIPAPVRRLPRLHVCTIAVILLSTALLVLINIPGEQVSVDRHHGWPFVYLERHGKCGCFSYFVPTTWSLVDRVEAFRPWALIGNVATAAALIAAIGCAIEIWQMRFGSLLRFSLRTAAVGMLLCCLASAGLAYRVERCRVQARALERLGAHDRVTYETVLPSWLRELLPDAIARLFDELDQVNLADGPVQDEDLAALCDLRDITSIDLTDTAITNAGLVHLRQLHRLQALRLGGTTIDNDGLRILSQLPELDFLCCEKTKIDDRGIGCLGEFPKLNSIWLDDCAITDAGLAALKQMPQLTFISADRTHATEEGLMELSAHLERRSAADE